jgi:hypothetical protein
LHFVTIVEFSPLQQRQQQQQGLSADLSLLNLILVDQLID